ncbi:MAG: TatD family hydrolase [Lentisphaerota bacterium]
MPAHNPQLIDAHCHAQAPELQAHINAWWQRAEEAGVTGFHCCGTEESDWQACMDLRRQKRNLFISLGLHPWFIRNRSPKWLSKLSACLAKTPAGIGEIGLDHALTDLDPEDQESVFKSQLKLSYELRKPVSIHCRQAWQRLPLILEELGRHPVGMMIHSYSGPAELVPRLTPLGVYFSFSGSITRSGNKKGRKALCAVPGDRLLIETDAPDIMPVLPKDRQPWIVQADGKPLSEPAYLPLVLKTVAELRGTGEMEMAAMIFENTLRLLGGIMS